jgi:hypothetical protein
MLKSRYVNKKKPRGKYWKLQRALAIERANGKCECCLLEKATDADHLFAEAWLRKFVPKADPHNLVNLLAICKKNGCHGRKTGADRKLWRADLLGFLQACNAIPVPMNRLEEAMTFYQIRRPR